MWLFIFSAKLKSQH